MSPKNKRILLICKETYSYPLYYLAKEWKKENTIGAFFFNPVETKYHKCDLNDTTYYRYQEDKDIRLFDSNEITDEFTKNMDHPAINQDELTKLEETYSHYKNFNLQILTTQFFTRHYHYRNYMSYCTYEQQLYWIVLNYRNILKILDDFNPDYIIDTDSAELARSILIEVAYQRHIPYLTLEFPRYEMYKTISFQQGYGVDPYFIDRYHDNVNLTDDQLKEEIKYVLNFREKNKIMSSEYKHDITASYNPDGTVSIFKKYIRNVTYFVINQDLKAGNLRLKKTNKILFNDSHEYLKFFRHYYRTRNKLMRPNALFEAPVDGEKYIYMPLHLIPESSTFVKAPVYINELSVIEAVSKALPAGWYLYVKEHQSMVGERGIEFYKKAKKIPNVRLVQLNYYKDPKPWIVKSMGVVTITGTTAYEAALLGKPAFVFGDVPFNVIDGITRVHSFEELPGLFRHCKEQHLADKLQSDNIHSCAAYIKTVKDLGQPVNVNILLDEGLPDLRYHKEPSEEFKESLENLKKLFERYMTE